MPRAAAFRILRSGSAAPLREVDRVAARRHLEPRDRALLRRIVGTEVRRRGSLRALVAAFTDRPPNPDVAALLRIGFVQLFLLDQVPPHAAVSETVRAAADALGLPKSRLVNAVLRAALRASRPESSGDPRRDLPLREISFDRPVFRDPEQHPFLWAEDALSMPAPLVKRWAKRHGRERALELARAALVEPELSLRVVRGEREALAAELAALGLEPRAGVHDSVLLLPPRAAEAVVHSAPFEEGRLSVQGETALRAAELVGARAGERVLELCAAPGGKTAVLAGAGARVLALDSNRTRLARVPSGLARLAPPGAVAVAAMDGARGLRPDALFDAALVDAPCSNTGVLAARPGARWRFGPASQAGLRELQARLLAEAARHLRPGGRLVYATCSLEPDENERLVRAFLESTGGWELAEEHAALPVACGRAGPVDGGYAALLRRARA